MRSVGGGKHCPRCASERPLSAFSSNRTARDRLDAYCRTCNARRIRLKKQRYADCGRCIDCGQARSGSETGLYCASCTAKRSAWSRGRYHALRTAALRQYGGDPPMCRCCGEPNVEFLTLDHIGGGGSAHRRVSGSVYGICRELT